MDVPGIRLCIMGLTRMHHRRHWFLHASGHSRMGNIQRSQHQQNETDAKRPVQKARMGSIADYQSDDRPLAARWASHDFAPHWWDGPTACR
jgi:hypothetical protein